MDPPHIKASCGTQKNNSNPMGIGLGLDYVTWWKILNGSPPHQTFMWDTKEKFPSYGYKVRN